MLVFLSNIINNSDLKMSSDIIYLDFKKVFDSVPHKELLFKLWRIGITRPYRCNSSHTCAAESTLPQSKTAILQRCLSYLVFSREILIQKLIIIVIYSNSMSFRGISLGSGINLREEDNLSTTDKWPVPKVSSLQMFYCIRANQVPTQGSAGTVSLRSNSKIIYTLGYQNITSSATWYTFFHSLSVVTLVGVAK